MNQEEAQGLQTSKAASKAKAAAHEEAVYKRLGFRAGDRVLLVERGILNGFSGTVTGYETKMQALDSRSRGGNPGVGKGTGYGRLNYY